MIDLMQSRVFCYLLLQLDPMVLSVLTPTQQSAVDYVREQSKAEASEQYSGLCMRIIELGYTPKDLQR